MQNFKSDYCIFATIDSEASWGKESLRRLLSALKTTRRGPPDGFIRMARDFQHLRHQSANQLTDIDQLATSPSASASTGSLRSRTNLRGAVHWASKFDVVEVLGGEGEDSYRPNTGTYGQYVMTLAPWLA
jgi:hypothetical protein